MNASHNAPGRRRFLQTAAAGAVLGPYGLALGGRLIAAGTPGAPISGWPNFAKGAVVRTGDRRAQRCPGCRGRARRNRRRPRRGARRCEDAVDRVGRLPRRRLDGRHAHQDHRRRQQARNHAGDSRRDGRARQRGGEADERRDLRSRVDEARAGGNVRGCRDQDPPPHAARRRRD